jgi:ribonuclease HI
MNKFILFTDASADSKSKAGFGVYLLIMENELDSIQADEIGRKILLKKFDSTTSTKLEIETLLWALEELEKKFSGK